MAIGADETLGLTDLRGVDITGFGGNIVASGRADDNLDTGSSADTRTVALDQDGCRVLDAADGIDFVVLFGQAPVVGAVSSHWGIGQERNCSMTVATGDDSDNGALAWDADGAAANAPVSVAFLLNLPALSVADFVFRAPQGSVAPGGACYSVG